MDPNLRFAPSCLLFSHSPFSGKQQVWLLVLADPSSKHVRQEPICLFREALSIDPVYAQSLEIERGPQES